MHIKGKQYLKPFKKTSFLYKVSFISNMGNYQKCHNKKHLKKLIYDK